MVPPSPEGIPVVYTHLVRSARRWSCVLFAVLACKGADAVKPLGDSLGGASGGVSNNRRSSTGGSGGGGTAGIDAGTATEDAGTDAAVASGNCGDLTCRGAGRCATVDGKAACVCDPGYVLSSNECIVDETCINLRLLEKGCRQRQGNEPSLGIFFGLETCAGTTVHPEIIGNLDQAFKVLEDGNALGDESYVALFHRDVESYVSIALDLSGSLQRDQSTLVAVIATLKQMVESLRPAPGAPPVSVELIVFGRTVQIKQGFTSDLSAVATALDVIQADPAHAIEDPGGTNLFGAVNAGMGELDSAAKGRLAQTLGGVVTTGTLVTITDGRDSSGVQLQPLDKRFNFISIGISSDIDDTELTKIGTQGSFLAPTQADWGAAFDSVVQRVLQYPQRSYLLGYCSPAVEGNHDVTVTLANRTANTNATCRLDATQFGSGVCNDAFINGYCGSRSCGSFLACGACPLGDAGAQSPNDTWSFTN